MIEVSSLVALIVGEVLVGLVILSGLLVLFTLLRKGRIRKAANHLAERVKSDKPKRQERLQTLLKDRFQYKDVQLDQAVHNIMQSEMLLYQNVINGFLKDDQMHLQQIDVDVENLVLNYQGLALPEGVASTSDTNVVSTASENEEIANLKEENERLSDELRVTMDTMSRMLNEYSSMFADGMGVPVVPPPQVLETATAEMSAEPEAVDTLQQQASEESLSSEDEMVWSGLDEEIPSQSDADTEIPDMTAAELQEASSMEEISEDVEEQDLESVPPIETRSMDEDAEEVDEEVSEIIDEVMEIADEMIQESESSVIDEQADLSGESLVDDLDKIDIEIPDVDVPVTEAAEYEAGSLEEEWAKLLEEDAATDESDTKPEKDQ